MKTKNYAAILFILIITASCSNKQTNAQPQSGNSEKKVGGSCEGCEAIHETIIPFHLLNYVDTLPDFDMEGPKLEISGTVYKQDGKTPAPGVVLYIYHTDQKGEYPRKGNESGWARRHGYLRGWMRTNDQGQYKFYTLKPASYPNSTAAAHIHTIIKEEGMNEYYIHDFLFEDDPFLTKEENQSNKPGGSGVLRLQNQNGRLIGKRDIFLGKNIINYPARAGVGSTIKSGLALGTNCPAFDPQHVSGPDKGESACPMCKYGRGQGIMVWWNKEGIEELGSFIKNMENSIDNAGFEKLRVFVMYMNPSGRSKDQIQHMLNEFARENSIQKVALTYIPSPSDPETAGLYQINEKAASTIFIYKKRKVVDKYVNYDFNGNNLKLLKKLDLQPVKA